MKIDVDLNIVLIFAPATRFNEISKKAKRRALSSVGLEHLPYKQGVTGSNPVGLTKQKDFPFGRSFLFYTNLEIPLAFFRLNFVLAVFFPKISLDPF